MMELDLAELPDFGATGTSASIRDVPRGGSYLRFDFEGGGPSRGSSRTAPLDDLNQLLREVAVESRSAPAARFDEEDFAADCAHEAAHGAVAFCLGWDVTCVDARSGETHVDFPDYQSRSFRDRYKEHAVIAAAPAAFLGRASGRHEFSGDRLDVMRDGYMTFADARRLAERLVGDRYVQAVYDRLVAALRMVGRLDGAELQRVLLGVG